MVTVTNKSREFSEVEIYLMTVNVRGRNQDQCQRNLRV